VVSSSSLLRSSNFASVSGIEVIVLSSVPVSVDWDETRKRSSSGESKNRLESVSVVSNGARLSCSNFASVSGIEVIALSWVPVTVHWSESRGRSCA